ncbi:hypothetical protein BKA62DRAFT_154495 [Auriculariales sp. MPI-PUGE-AT-0066]|nr:hypothetical protein BKA62DRAFT_154495 [Auriculariales sp. MPI-PUGE-AT-0066]
MLEIRHHGALSPDSFESVAEVDWFAMKSSQVRFDGQEVTVDTFLRKKTLLGQSRSFLCGGVQFIWSDRSSGNLELRREGTDVVIASCIDSSTSEDFRLHISPGAHVVGFDLIVLSALIVHHKREDRRLRARLGVKGRNERRKKDDGDDEY